MAPLVMRGGGGAILSLSRPNIPINFVSEMVDENFANMAFLVKQGISLHIYFSHCAMMANFHLGSEIYTFPWYLS
jgi:hypothetical protein